MADCTRDIGAIQEMVDGTLDPIRQAELQRHLAACEQCRTLLEDLERIRGLAASLDRPVPPNHVWLHVAGQLSQEGRLAAAPAPPPPSSKWYAVAAIAATVVLAAGGALLLRSPAPGSGAAQVATAPAASGASPDVQAAQAPSGNAVAADAVQGGIEAEFTLAERHYQNAIAKLEAAARTDTAAIDPQTAAMLQKNLQVIDQAIAESRAALKSEPASSPARDSLFDALKRKVSVLQDTIALMNEMRKGNAAGVAQLVDGVNKG